MLYIAILRCHTESRDSVFLADLSSRQVFHLSKYVAHGLQGKPVAQYFAYKFAVYGMIIAQHAM